ncbi:hypothetical protein [uncultured Ruegeria sp.]|uniref:hypothetical protein n=1 Tax=uncultured Ruegeria sp. TaxID=259304 RepID=UPI00262629D1|nr:hypothetical protein [uncultured Ruegeria sp.]
MRLTKLALYLSGALMVAGCSTLQPASVEGVDRAIGDALPGARGETIEDQDRIDETVARACAAGIYRVDLCDLHTVVSAQRRVELAENGSFPRGHT